MRLSVVIATSAPPERRELGSYTDIWHLGTVFRKAGLLRNARVDG